MRWQVAQLYGVTETGRDALGNPTVERKDMGECMVRAVPWATEGNETTGNAFSDVARTVVTPKPLSAILGASQAVMDGETYSVEAMGDMGRMRTMVLRREKGERWGSRSGT